MEAYIAEVNLKSAKFADIDTVVKLSVGIHKKVQDYVLVCIAELSASFNSTECIDVPNTPSVE